MPHFTPEQYADDAGLHCPSCGSVSFEGHGFDVTAGKAYQEVTCNQCGASWYDEYKLVGYTELEP